MNEHTVDILVVGSGAGAMTAALRAAHAGADVLLVEKGDKYGGTSATSGGGLWIPCNHLMPDVGISDSREQALNYLHALTAGSVADATLEAFVDKGPEMLNWLEANSHVRYMAMEHYADYYQDVDGAAPGGRSIDPYPYQAQALGDEFLHMQDNHVQTKVLGLMGYTNIEGAILLSKSPGWFKLVLKLAFDYFTDIPGRLKSRKSRRLTMGNALIGRLRHSLLDHDVPLWRNCAARELVMEGGRLSGVIVEREGQQELIRARKGVVLASGGFEASQELRERHLPRPTNAKWSSANPLNTGDMLKAAEDIGAATHLMDEAWWGPSIVLPGEDRSRQLFTERSMPGCIMVNKNGERFVNESVAYTACVQAMQKQPDAKAWVIFDSRYKREYPFGPLLPDAMHLNWLQPGKFRRLLINASDISDLAEQLNVDTAALQNTIERFNAFSQSGVDADFHRGENAYDLMYGDVRLQPNPCLAPITAAPFYAMEVFPGDIGTKGGVLTNEHAQVLDKQGAVIDGLYAIGNCAASITGTSYPGAGATLGPAMTFGFIAAEHLCES